MTRAQIDRFFRVLAVQLGQKAVVLVTGAAAAAIWGRVRPSVDIDFAVRMTRRGENAWEAFEQAVARTVGLTGVQANYAEDLDHWGLITLLDYRRHTRSYRRFGALEVRLLDPTYWSIGKMTRYLDPDVRDMVQVFKRQRVPADRLVRLWGRALRRSPRSIVLSQFRRQVEHFLRTHGHAIWGRKFDAERALRRFYKEAGIGPP